MPNSFFLLSLYALIYFSNQAPNDKIFQLTYQNSKYLLSFNLGSKKSPIKLAIDTSATTSLVNSIKCIICLNTEGNQYDTSDSKQLSSEEISYKKMRHVYTGITYEDSFQIKDMKQSEDFNGRFAFLSTSNVSLISEVADAGVISLGYFSDFIKGFDTKILTLYLGDNSGTVTIGEINPEVVNINELVYYPMTIDQEEQLWYLTSDKLTITRPQSDPRDYASKHKIMIDSNTWQFYIPRSFFYENIETILPITCQISKNDIFYCTCLNEEQTTLFPTFNFTIGGNDISMGPHQYMTFSSSSNYCIAHFSINYYSEYWVIGINLLNEHNTIFDYEKKQIAFYDKTIANKTQSQFGTFISIFLSVGICSALLFFGGYCIYKRYHPILN